MRRYLILLILLLNAFPPVVSAEEGLPEVEFLGLLSARLAFTDDTVSWLDDGLGKTRYGGEDRGGGRRTQLRLGEASLLILPRLSWSLTGLFHIKYDEEQRYPVDLVEGFLNYRPVPTSPYGFKARLGAFFPPISLENKALAWTSPYTITPSAINTWVGEELRTIGGEATIFREGEDNVLGVTGAVFAANDPAGTLLAWRGWAMHDRKTGLFDRLPLAPIPSIQPGARFSRQAPWVEPFHEIDGRVGFYIGGSWEHMDFFGARILYYDNRADLKGFDGSQYAWHTRFTSLGMTLDLPGQVEFLSQFMVGDTSMGRSRTGRVPVDVDFWASYAMVSKSLERHRFSLRYDRFDADDRENTPTDDNGEKGVAWTLAYTLKTTPKQRLMLEALGIKSHRPIAEDMGLDAHPREFQFQVSYNIFF